MGELHGLPLGVHGSRVLLPIKGHDSGGDCSHHQLPALPLFMEEEEVEHWPPGSVVCSG